MIARKINIDEPLVTVKQLEETKPNNVVRVPLRNKQMTFARFRQDVAQKTQTGTGIKNLQISALDPHFKSRWYSPRKLSG